ncbi:MAG: hypothetical protein P1S60_19450 [Anaerolineae bacterium]|nr:hypothetical protein [Anaerolineae bacterium]
MSLFIQSDLAPGIFEVVAVDVDAGSEVVIAAVVGKGVAVTVDSEVEVGGVTASVVSVAVVFSGGVLV